MSRRAETARLLLARLDALGVRYEHYAHQPIAHAAERHTRGLAYDAIVCKNLLLTVRNQSRFWLLMLPAQKTADLKRIARAIGSARLCFAPDTAAEALLRQSSGSIGVLGVCFDHAHEIEVLFDASLDGAPRVALHPGDNAQTLVMRFEDILRFVRACGARVRFVDAGESGE